MNLSVWLSFKASKTKNFSEIIRIIQKHIDHISGDEISVLMKKFEKLSSVAHGWKNNVYNGTPCTPQTH